MENKSLQIYGQLLKVQTKLKVPKNNRNSFGNYNYRSCEDILNLVKPLLTEHDLTLVLTDEIIHMPTSDPSKVVEMVDSKGKNKTEVIGGDRYYVKATAILSDGKDVIQVSALAREAQHKAGMDEAQITGSASSYARKYALSGLFAIDDTTDADGETGPIEPAKPKAPVKAPAKPVVVEQKPEDPVTPKQKQQLKNMMTALGMDKDGMSMMIVSALEKDTVDTFEDFNKIIEALES